jgi:CDGSH-type Zn-finger protein
MADVTIRVNANGPYLVQGPVQLLDGQGNAFSTKADKPIALCRCGQSANKPFCDGTHRSAGFQSEVSASGQA